MADLTATERRNPRSSRIDAVATRELLEIIHAEDEAATAAVGRELPRIAEALDRIEERFRRGGRLFYVGAGTSGRLGVLDASELKPTFNLEPGRVIALIAGGDTALRNSVEGAEDDESGALGELERHELNESDSVLGIAAGGRTPYVIGALRHARSRGALTVAVCSNPEAAAFEHADIAVAPDTGPEVISGSTRMKAGTAQKMVLNMLSTGLMVRLGYVLGNLMVNVQPTNSKLRERGRRIVMEVAQVGEEQASQALEQAEDVREAILIARGLTRTESRALLAKHRGVLRGALEELQGGRRQA